MAIAKRQGTAVQAGEAITVDVCELAMEIPSLYEWITATRYDDGATRTPGSLTIFSGTDGTLRCCTNDKDTQEMFFTTGSTLSELLRRVDRALAEGTADWRSSRKSMKKK